MTGLFEQFGAHPFWIWAALAGALLAAEVATGSGWMLWPAASAGVVALLLLAFPAMPTHLAVLLFAVITITATLLSRRYLMQRTLPGGVDINDPMSRVIGFRGKAVTEFKGGEGRVFVDGKEWAAKADVAVGSGDSIEVTAVDGAVLRIRPA